jgi:hypothetical protein
MDALVDGRDRLPLATMTWMTAAFEVSPNADFRAGWFDPHLFMIEVVNRVHALA